MTIAAFSYLIQLIVIYRRFILRRMFSRLTVMVLSVVVVIQFADLWSTKMEGVEFQPLNFKFNSDLIGQIIGQ